MEQLPDLHIQRPYDSLDEYLEGDFWTVERKDMFLIGADQIELGVAVKFTIELADGTPVVTGEGRVVEYTAPSDEFPGGLKVRFRQIDAESKAVLRRALEVRRRAYAAALEAQAAETAAADDPGKSPEGAAPAPIAAAELPAPEAAPVSPPAPARSTRASTPPKPRSAERHRTTPPGVPQRLARVVSPPPNRDVLLGRLRDRARTFAPGTWRAS